MASVVLTGDTSGQVTLSAPAIAGTNTVTLPAATGTTELIGVGTAVASTSGTAIDFTSIPSWAKRVTVMLVGVSLSGTDNLLLQIGSGSVLTSGYTGYGTRVGSAGGGYSANSTGFVLSLSSANADIRTGQFTINLFSGNIYVCTGMQTDTNASNGTCFATGSVTLSGVLDRVRITTTGTNTFDAGQINIMWEG